MFSFKDDDEQWVSLRYDLTAPLARYVAEHYDRLPKPFRSYRAGWVFRNEKPGPGRYRQFMQFDADTVGAASAAADAEICMMAADCLEALGIKRGDYVVKVNNRKVLDGMMETIGLGDADERRASTVILRAIDKLDRLGPRACLRTDSSRKERRERRFHEGRGAETHIEHVLRPLSSAPRFHWMARAQRASVRRWRRLPAPAQAGANVDRGSCMSWRQRGRECGRSRGPA